MRALLPLLGLLAAACDPARAGQSSALDGGPGAAPEEPPAAAPGPEREAALERALERALQRNASGLHLPGAPELYHLRYRLALLRQLSVHASYGALVSVDDSPANALGVEVRLGGPDFDNTGCGGWENGMGRLDLPDGLTPHALEESAWWITDRAYKEAVEQYSRKRASCRPPPGHPGDFQLGFSVQADDRRPLSWDAGLVELARRLSAAVEPSLPLERLAVLLVREAGDLLVLDTEGTRAWRSEDETLVRGLAFARAEDGMLLAGEQSWYVSGPSQLPPEEQMAAELRELAERVVEASRLPVLSDEYVGPVIFEGDAAVELFQELLVPQLEGTPPPLPFHSVFGELGEGGWGEGGRVRLGRRVLPRGWSVRDDPRLDPSNPASFLHDDEGTPARAVQLVTDGIARDLLMSRVPRKGLAGTNGHARGALGERLEGRAAMLEVRPPHHRSRRHLRRVALELARDYGLDHVLLVRHFQDEAVRRMGSDELVYADEPGPRLPLPLEVIALYADGHEEHLRGARFSTVARWMLRDLPAAGPQVSRTVLAPFHAGEALSSPVVGLATWLSVPEVVVGEMEVVPAQVDPHERRLLPRPQP